MEKERRITQALSLLSLIGVAYFSLIAFSEGTRKEVGRNNRWTCERCGRKFSEGWVIHICHYDHDKNNPKYDSPENGWCGCVQCHLRSHIEEAGRNGLNQSQNNWAIHELETTQPRTYEWLRKNGRSS